MPPLPSQDPARVYRTLIVWTPSVQAAIVPCSTSVLLRVTSPREAEVDHAPGESRGPGRDVEGGK